MFKKSGISAYREIMTIDSLRLRLDDLDHQIATLLNDRIEIVDQIGGLKQKENLSILDENREKAVIEGVTSAIKHPILKEEIAEIYQLILRDAKINQHFNRYADFPFRSVGFIGFGLIGGSIAKAIKTKKPDVLINVLEKDDLSEQWIDNICSSPHELALHSDLILLATPISCIIPYADEIAKLAQDKTLHKTHPLIIVDVASVKADIVSHFEKLSHPLLEFIGTHPVGGKEVSGLENSAATLFVNRPWIIVPHSANTENNLEKIEQMIRFCGSNPLYLEKHQHDRHLALVSHLPAFLARSFFKFVQESNPQALESAGPGFASFTRLAHDNPVLYQEILETNRPNIDRYRMEWIEFLKTAGG